MTNQLAGVIPRVVSTEQMLAEGVLTGDGRANWYLPLAGPLETPEVDLSVDPYVLGCWLGDGHTAGSMMTIGNQDQNHFIAEFEQRGYKLTWRYELGWATVPVSGTGKWQGYKGPWRVLTRELQAVGLLNRTPKHIPAPYLRASAKQRLELLQGLMDTDGSVSATTGIAELGLANRALLEQARELVLSLGHKAHQIRYHPIRLADGRIAKSWRLTWTPRDPVFLMEPKARAQASGVSGRQFGSYTRRTVVSIERIPSVPVRCISVSSQSHLFLAGDGMVPTHNTAFALGIASHAAMHANVPTLFFSLEMSHLEITQRMLSSEAQVNASRMRNGKLHESDWPKISHAIGRLGEAPLFVDDNPNLTIMDMRAKARRLKSRDGLGLVVVDYIQLMTGRNSAENRQVEVSEISRGLKILARELEVPVIALSQLSRSLEQRADKRPMLADLRESGSIEQDADVVMFLYRDEVYNAESPDRGTAEVIVAKHRNGPTGTARLAFLDHYAKFANMAREP